jgi:hypothetical protein
MGKMAVTVKDNAKKAAKWTWGDWGNWSRGCLLPFVIIFALPLVLRIGCGVTSVGNSIMWVGHNVFGGELLPGLSDSEKLELERALEKERKRLEGISLSGKAIEAELKEYKKRLTYGIYLRGRVQTDGHIRITGFTPKQILQQVLNKVEVMDKAAPNRDLVPASIDTAKKALKAAIVECEKGARWNRDEAVSKALEAAAKLQIWPDAKALGAELMRYCNENLQKTKDPNLPH